jgi:hypothetical protein
MAQRPHRGHLPTARKGVLTAISWRSAAAGGDGNSATAVLKQNPALESSSLVAGAAEAERASLEADRLNLNRVMPAEEET